MSVQEWRPNPEIVGAFHSAKNSGLKFRVFRVANGTVFSGRLCQPVTFQKCKFCAKIQNKSKQTNGGLMASFTCFDGFEVKLTNKILSEDDDFIFSVQLAVTCERISIDSATT